MAKREEGQRKAERKGIWADSYESLNRCFTMAFCFACFIEQRADIHVNLALSQSARTGREPSSLPSSHPRTNPATRLFFLASFFFLCYSL